MAQFLLSQRRASPFSPPALSAFAQHSLYLLHIVVVYRNCATIIPSYDNAAPSVALDRAKIGCGGFPANAVASFQESGLFAGHWLNLPLADAAW